MLIYFLMVLILFGLAQLSSSAQAEPLLMFVTQEQCLSHKCHRDDSTGTVAEPLAALAAQTPWPWAMGRAWGGWQGPQTRAVHSVPAPLCTGCR